MASRSLQDLDKDAAVRLEAAKSWTTLNSATDGDRAVGGAQYNYELKSANAVDAAAPAFSGGGGGRGGSSEVRRSLGLSRAPVGANAPAEVRAREQLVQYTEQTRFVNGRNFFQNGSQWSDAEVQKLPQANRVRIQFNSSEYFTFAAKNPQALPWLSLGSNVQFVLDGKVYEVYE